MNRPGLFDHDRLQPLGRGLDRALVDVAADPAAAEFLGHGGGGAGADETVEDEIIGVGGSSYYPINNVFRFLCRIIKYLLRLIVDWSDVVPDILR